MFTRDMNETHCTHRRQVRVADTNEWVCEDCFAAMDATDPTQVVSEVR